MSTRSGILAVGLGLMAVLVLAGPAATAPPPAPPDPTCSPGPSNCGAWHTSNVTVTWSAPPAGVTASGCGTVTITTDTTGAPVSCTWSNADGSRTTTAIVRRDATPPSVRAAPDRGPDAGGWYNRAVRVVFSGTDATSGVGSCSSPATYGGPDSERAVVSGTCSDVAGNSGGASAELRYDATAPKVEAKPSRQPNAKGWYNRAVTVSFVGEDTVSGVDSCTAPITYNGPDADKTSLAGSCRDRAANASPPTGFELKFDTKPPTLGRVKAEIASKAIVLTWTASKDSDSFVVVRRPGLRNAKPSTIYSGKARSFSDRRLESGARYRYTVAAYDEAGNAAAKGLVARYSGPTVRVGPSKPAASKPAAAGPALRSPAAGARLRAPPVLVWRAVPGATYYNVQLYRDGKKVLSLWPTGRTLRLERTWTYAGRTHRLAPGRYRWYVWPGFGPRSQNRYGKLLGTREFVITR